MTKEKQTHRETGFEIAIIGMAGRFPGAKNIDEFWENLKNGRETISFFSQEEIEAVGVDPAIYRDPNYVKARGHLEDQGYFDAAFFNYTPLEAEIMDPQVRIFHECCWQALEHAGYNPSTYRQLIGLYAGASAALNWEAYHLFSPKVHILGGYAASLLRKDYLCTKTSYKLGLRGPSFYVQTACSTSLLAIHLAGQGLINGECHIALAGGVGLTHQGTAGYLYQEGTIGSNDGHCRAFDARAAGTVRGEGVGIVVLKLLDKARREGDTIHAVIKGSAINNDGDRKVGFTAPSINGQAEVIWAALQMAEVEPGDISYIETHGTGTRLGDPVEISALKKVFQNKKKNSCALGTVKSNIGHLDTAAGAAGVIKTVLALEHRLIPPSLHIETLNPEIDFAGSPFYVDNVLAEWKSDGHPLRAGVSSFGIGGTNVHVVMEEAPPGPPPPGPSSKSRENHLFLLSAKTEPALHRLRKNLARHLSDNPGINLADAAYTLQVGRKIFRHRFMAVVSGAADPRPAVEALTAGSAGNSLANENHRPVVFMFPGQGAQYENMGWGLYRTEPLFRDQMDRCFDMVKSYFNYDIKEILYRSYRSNRSDQSDRSDHSDRSDIDQTEITQPLLFIFEYALAQLLMKWGIQPYAMIGHSIGEYVAACLSGVLTLEDALRLVCIRGQAMQKIPTGSMLSVPLSAGEVKPLLNAQLSIAAENTTARCVVSGTHEAIAELDRQLKEKGHTTRQLHTSHAFHSAMMDPIAEEFAGQVKSLRLNKPGIPYISNLTGTWITSEAAADPHYWARHLRETVRYADGLSELLKKEEAVFLEVGPGNVLSTFTTQHRDKKPGQLVLSLVKHPRDQVTDDYFLMDKIGRLWIQGVSVDWQSFNQQGQRRRIPLPTYPFEGNLYPYSVNLREIFAASPGKIQSPGETAPTSLPAGTPQGQKIDPPAPARQSRPTLSTPYAPPRDKNEQALAAVFEQFFGIQPVGIHDNFYELGGDSLNAVQLANLLRKVNIGITFQQLLENQSISGLCKNVAVPGKPTVMINMKDIEQHLEKKYNTGVYYREYRCREVPYRILFLDHQPIAVQEVLAEITGMTAGTPVTQPVPYPNYVVFGKPGEDIPGPGIIDEKQFNTLLELEDGIKGADPARLPEQLNLGRQLTSRLKKNNKTATYDVSPVQRAYLVPPYRNIAANFIYYSHLFTYPVELTGIQDIVAAVLVENPLLRSVIVEKAGRYQIEEFAGISDLQLPYLDISGNSPAAQKEIVLRINRYLREPMQVIDQVLFRAAVLKVDHSHIKLVMLFNHLIFDGTSIALLDNQLERLSGKKEVTPPSHKPAALHYRDYVEFMKAQNYRGRDFEKYLDTHDYIRSCVEISKNYKVSGMKVEVFDLDISIIAETHKNNYEEIILLTYGKLIRELYGVERAPVTFVSNGRIYKDGKFNTIIGEFPDEIPVLLSFDRGKSAGELMEHFIDYKRFIRENNFNFYNYLAKGNWAGRDKNTVLSPFVFNSLMGSYELLTRIRSEEPDMLGEMGNLAHPFFYMGVLEDFYAGRVGIRFLHNSGLGIKEVFLKNYRDLVRSLD